MSLGRAGRSIAVVAAGRTARLILGLISIAGCVGCRKEPAAHRVESAGPRPWFTDIAAQSGLTEPTYGGGPNKDHILESVGTGVALVDFDGDGLLDVFLPNAWVLDEEPPGVRLKGRSHLYRNTGTGRFVDVSNEAGVADDSWGCGVCAGDYDNDGHVDLYVTNFGPNRLYRNLGDGRFEEVAARAGVDDAGWGAGASFFDADNDGDLDLYVVNYIDCTMDEVLNAHRSTLWRGKIKVMNGPFGMRGGRDRFYRNKGDGTFEDATDAVGMTDLAEGYGLGVLASDLDQDGDVDVYVANDSNPNYLYRNEGNGMFKDIGLWSGAGVKADGVAQAGMGVDAADYDGDGLADIFVTNFAQDYSTLYRNGSGLNFEDVTALHSIKNVTFPYLSWGCSFLDMDLDAAVDLFVVNGHIYPQVDEHSELGEGYRQRPLVFRNHAGRFEDATAESGLSVSVSGRGLATGDVDGDGDLDLLVMAMDAPPLLLRNDVPRKGHWLELRLLNRFGSPAINARAKVRAGGLTQQREVRSGSTYASQSALDVHFGLGQATFADEVEVRWLGGGRSVLYQVGVNQLIVVRESVENAP